jgi:MFS family permease
MMKNEDEQPTDDQSGDGQPAYELPDLNRPASATPTESELEHELPGAEQLGAHDPYAAFRYRDYRLYAIGGTLNALGGQMQSVAVGWEIYERTNSAMSLGLVGLVQAIPVILLSLPAGQIADRYNRRVILLIALVLSSLCSLGLAVLSYQHGPVEWMYLLLLGFGIIGAFTGPATASILPQLVPPPVFSNAVTWNSTRWQIAATTGPALGGFVIALTHSVTPVYLITAFSTLWFFGFVVALRGRQQERSKETVTFQSLLAGIHFVRDTKLILATITMDMFAVLFGGATALLPIFARDILHVGPTGLGWLRAAPAVGALLMALTLAHLPPMRKAGKALLWAVAGFGAATIIFGLSRNFWLSLLMLAFTGAFDNISVIVRHTLVQVLTPDSMRGRVSAVNNVFIGTSNEIGEFESGALASLATAPGAVIIGGIGTILVVLGIAKIWPEVAELGALHEVEPAEIEKPHLKQVVEAN